MYSATERQRSYLRINFTYTDDMIDALEAFSNSVRRGLPVPMDIALKVVEYQCRLKEARTKTKRWWEFWK